MGGLWTGIRPEATSATSKMVSDYSGMLIQPHKVTSLSICALAPASNGPHDDTGVPKICRALLPSLPQSAALLLARCGRQRALPGAKPTGMVTSQSER